MPRKKYAPLPYWQSRSQERGESFIRLGVSLLKSKAWKSLSGSAKAFYLALMAEGRGNDTVSFPHGIAKKYGVSASSYDRARSELIESGFIEQVNVGGMPQYSKNQFRFSLRWHEAVES